jgi:hypothetical protein
MTDKNNDQSNEGLYSLAYVRKRVRLITSGKLRPPSVNGTGQPKLSLKQAKWLTASRFVKALNPLLFITYQHTHPKLSYYRCAMQHVVNWINGTSEQLFIDYSRILVASGNRLNTDRATAKAVGSTILFQWDNDHLPVNQALDKAILVAYCEVLNKCLFTTMGPPRTAQRASLDASLLRGKNVHTWLSFIAPDGSEVADSVYTGLQLVH